jgi:hypothetical protein
MTTVIPQPLEITLPSVMRTPVLPENLHVKVYKSVVPICQIGIELAQMDNVAVKMYDRERTVYNKAIFSGRVGR